MTTLNDATRRVRLQREWALGDRIGGGGFGQVYAAESPGCVAAVAKLVPKSRGAQRELLFVDLAGVRNVVQIVSCGETHDHLGWCWVPPTRLSVWGITSRG